MKKLLSLMLNQEYIDVQKYATGHFLNWMYGLEQCSKPFGIRIPPNQYLVKSVYNHLSWDQFDGGAR